MRKRNETLTESDEQILLVTWLTKIGIRCSASANGGNRSLAYAAKLKRMGVSAGYPDISILLPKGCYHGCFIELKRRSGGILSRYQKEWLDYLNENGYYAQCCAGFDEAKEVVLYYLSLDGDKK